MTGRRRLLIAVLSALVLSLCIWCAFKLREILTPIHPTTIHVFGKADLGCQEVAQLLKLFYEQEDIETSGQAQEHFPSFAGNSSPHLFVALPKDPGSQVAGVALHLLLPVRLLSDQPTLIAYSGRFQGHRPKDAKRNDILETKRVACFLSRQEITVVVIDKESLRRIVGVDAFDEATPDLYCY